MEIVIGLIVLIAIIGVIKQGFEYLTKRRGKFIVKLIDPVTRNVRYLTGVDGISGSFNYSNDIDMALVFNDQARVEEYLAGVDSNASPTILKGTFSGWSKL